MALLVAIVAALGATVVLATGDAEKGVGGGSSQLPDPGTVVFPLSDDPSTWPERADEAVAGFLEENPSRAWEQSVELELGRWQADQPLHSTDRQFVVTTLRLEAGRHTDGTVRWAVTGADTDLVDLDQPISGEVVGRAAEVSGSVDRGVERLDLLLEERGDGNDLSTESISDLAGGDFRASLRIPSADRAYKVIGVARTADRFGIFFRPVSS